MVQKTIDYARAIKNVMPNSKVFGPVNYGWQGYVNFQNAPDAAGRDFLNYYLQQMRQAEQTYGKRLLDVLDVHWYPEAQGGGVRITGQDNHAGGCGRAPAGPALAVGPNLHRNQLDHAVVHLRADQSAAAACRSKIDNNYPGTKIAITEYNYGGGNHISGGIAEADVLGIFGRDRAYLPPTSGRWRKMNRSSPARSRCTATSTAKTAPSATPRSSPTTNNDAASSIYASLDSQNPNRMVLVAINKTDHTINALMNLQHALPFALAEVYQLTGSSADPQYVDSLLINDPANFNYTMPAYSVSTINVRPAMGLKRNLLWNQAGGTWDTAVSTNRPWLTDGHNAFFLLGDQATFGDAGVGNVVHCRLRSGTRFDSRAKRLGKLHILRRTHRRRHETGKNRRGHAHLGEQQYLHRRDNHPRRRPGLSRPRPNKHGLADYQ